MTGPPGRRILIRLMYRPLVHARAGDESLVTHGNEVQSHTTHLLLRSDTIGRFCAICGHSRPNEQFGGRGERARVCRQCRKRPHEERRRILLQEEILGFLDQSNISSKNLRRLGESDIDIWDDETDLVGWIEPWPWEADPLENRGLSSMHAP